MFLLVEPSDQPPTRPRRPEGRLRFLNASVPALHPWSERFIIRMNHREMICLSHSPEGATKGGFKGLKAPLRRYVTTNQGASILLPANHNHKQGRERG